MIGLEELRALRPGVSHGGYPENPESADRASGRTFGFACRGRYKLAGLTKRNSRFVDMVEKQTTTIQTLNDAHLKARTQELRYQLVKDGLGESIIAQIFGLVREVADRTLGMRHYPSQLIGGRVLLDGNIAEMETGEGKTLTATLPACVAAFADIPTHIITVNDYLAARDAELMRPIYEFLGLSVGVVTENLNIEQRRWAYAQDITYCTNKQVAFDYMRDRLARGDKSGPLHAQVDRLQNPSASKVDLILRGLHFAIVDEADSVLIDEARTPLILSKPGENPVSGDDYQHALTIAQNLRIEADFTLDAQNRAIELSPRGQEKLTNLAQARGSVWQRKRFREELVTNGLKAIHLHSRDVHYLVQDGKVHIIDEFTGRTMPDRSWSHGIHQMVEAKEDCPITPPMETVARFCYQRFFRRYLRLAGMSGTAGEVTGELKAVYGVSVVRVPTHKPVKRRVFADRVYATAEQKWNAVVDRIRQIHRQNRPVLIGTRSVEESERLSQRLTDADLPHEVLNARQDAREAEIVGLAGGAGRITVATNMAGRGTDIALAPGVAEAGGLHVIATERHDSRRIDRQLFGRCARQGDPGSAEAMLAMDDELVSHYGPKIAIALGELLRRKKGLIPKWAASRIVTLAQRIAERRHTKLRHDLLRLDGQITDLLAFSGRSE